MIQKKQLILYAVIGALGVAAGASVVLFLADKWPQASLEVNVRTSRTAPFHPVREPWGGLPYETLQLFKPEPSPLLKAGLPPPSSERLAAKLLEKLEARPDGSLPFSPLLPPHFLDILPYTGTCPADAKLEALLHPPQDYSFEQQLMLQRSQLYLPVVRKMAREYHVDPALILAVMQVESRFMPHESSNRNAHGLMQIVPGTAGREIWRWLKLEGRPAVSELMQPEQNIRYGTIYLHLLLEHHFGGILHPLSREYCVIASYNGGSGVVLRIFGETPEEAFKLVNSMPPEEVYDMLMTRLPSGETRAFLQQVLAARHIYRVELGLERKL